VPSRIFLGSSGTLLDRISHNRLGILLSILDLFIPSSTLLSSRASLSALHFFQLLDCNSFRFGHSLEKNKNGLLIGFELKE
jgi:hypothetical protein